jgi:hypothetical protein
MKEIMQTYGAMIVAVVVGIALLSGFGALKNKMSVAFAPQDILSSDSANDSYDGMKNIPVPGIELKEKMRQNAVSYSVYDSFFHIIAADRLFIHDIHIWLVISVHST